MKPETVEQIFDLLKLIEINTKLRLNEADIKKIKEKFIEVLREWSKQRTNWNQM